MREITVQDCLNLKAKFDNYCETAEQHQFPLLFSIGIRLDITLDKIKTSGKVENQKDIRAMFRVILKVIGEDWSEYEEKEEKHDALVD